MPPFILAALPVVLAALGVALGGALLVGPFVLPLYLRKLSSLDRERLLAAAKGAYLVVSGIARMTPTSLDDDLAKVVKMVEEELGKTLRPKQKLLVVNASKAMHADPRLPNLGRG